mmetsp:Transcript_42366/g.106797  ORF Transcript_42366/g.106797 Transcript_42366/m.106797 type:complete len:214 (+) Transcript_42366:2700-3341(+)
MPMALFGTGLGNASPSGTVSSTSSCVLGSSSLPNIVSASVLDDSFCKTSTWPALVVSCSALASKATSLATPASASSDPLLGLQSLSAGNSPPLLQSSACAFPSQSATAPSCFATSSGVSVHIIPRSFSELGSAFRSLAVTSSVRIHIAGLPSDNMTSTEPVGSSSSSMDFGASSTSLTTTSWSKDWLSSLHMKRRSPLDRSPTMAAIVAGAAV